MKAAVVTGPGQMKVIDVERPAIEPGAILLKIEACAVCGSDLRIYETGNNRVSYPAIIGHEMAGEIVEVGAGVEKFSLNDRVCLGADVPCGQCYWCLNGMGNCCEENYAMGYQFAGGFAEYCLIKPMVVSYGPVARVPAGLSLEEAALAEPLGCCLNGLERVSFKPGKSVLIIGAGAIGIMLAETARCFGSPMTMLADIDTNRLEQAAPFNPDHLINSSQNDLLEVVRDLTGGQGADIIFTACPSPQAQELAVKAAAKRGSVNFFGGLAQNAGNINISSNDVHYKELLLTGSHGATPVHHALALRLIASGRIKVANLISHRFPLSEIDQAFEMVKQRKGLKVIVRP